MSEDQFTAMLRQFTRQRPFIPFVVTLLDGERIIVEEPHVAFGGGAAGFLSDTEGPISFRCEQVQSIEHLRVEASR